VRKWKNLIRFACSTNFPACDDCVCYKEAFNFASETRCEVNLFTWKQYVCFVFYGTPYCGIIALLPAQDALDKYELARSYKSHLDAVASDRELESHLQASWLTNWLKVCPDQPPLSDCVFILGKASNPLCDGDALLLVSTEPLQHLVWFRFPCFTKSLSCVSHWP
jgi:hypothetical protein